MNHVAKIIEVVGTSDASVEDAIKGAITRAAKTLDNLQWFEVTEVRGQIQDQTIERFQVLLKIGFVIVVVYLVSLVPYPRQTVYRFVLSMCVAAIVDSL